MDRRRQNGLDTSVNGGDGKLRVFFDGACPVCSREIAFYRGLRDDDAIAWVDVTAADFTCEGLTRASALSRLHVRTADGRLVNGVPAFRELWLHLPALKWLYLLSRPRAMQWLLERAYEFFLRRRARARAA